MDNATRALAQAHYAQVGSKGGYAGRCAMQVPEGLEGLRVLDVCCRKGKGAYELSDHTGQAGYVLGVDPEETCIEKAAERAPENHWAGANWQRYMGFSRAMPEDLSQAGVCDASFDLVYVNSALNAVWSLPVALREFARVLREDGRLWVADAVFAEQPLNSDVREAFRGSGNVFASALTVGAFRDACLAAGFTRVSFSSAQPVCPDGFDADEALAGKSYSVCNACAFI